MGTMAGARVAAALLVCVACGTSAVDYDVKPLYRTLNLTSNTVKPREIKKMYQKWSRMLHPDVTKWDKGVARAKMAEVTRAYEVLIDDERRKEYDSTGEQKAKSNNEHNRQFLFTEGPIDSHVFRHINMLEKAIVTNKETWAVFVWGTKSAESMPQAEVWKKVAARLRGAVPTAAWQCDEVTNGCYEAYKLGLQNPPPIPYIMVAKDGKVSTYSGRVEQEHILAYVTEKGLAHADAASTSSPPGTLLRSAPLLSHSAFLGHASGAYLAPAVGEATLASRDVYDIITFEYGTCIDCVVELRLSVEVLYNTLRRPIRVVRTDCTDDANAVVCALAPRIEGQTWRLAHGTQAAYYAKRGSADQGAASDEPVPEKAVAEEKVANAEAEAETPEKDAAGGDDSGAETASGESWLSWYGKKEKAGDEGDACAALREENKALKAEVESLRLKLKEAEAAGAEKKKAKKKGKKNKKKKEKAEEKEEVKEECTESREEAAALFGQSEWETLKMRPLALDFFPAKGRRWLAKEVVKFVLAKYPSAVVQIDILGYHRLKKAQEPLAVLYLYDTPDTSDAETNWAIFAAFAHDVTSRAGLKLHVATLDCRRYKMQPECAQGTLRSEVFRAGSDKKTPHAIPLRGPEAMLGECRKEMEPPVFTKLTEDTFDKMVYQEGVDPRKRVAWLVAFSGGAWCPPCKLLNKQIPELSRLIEQSDFADQVRVGYVDCNTKAEKQYCLKMLTKLDTVSGGGLPYIGMIQGKRVSYFDGKKFGRKRSAEVILNWIPTELGNLVEELNAPELKAVMATPEFQAEPSLLFLTSQHSVAHENRATSFTAKKVSQERQPLPVRRIDCSASAPEQKLCAKLGGREYPGLILFQNGKGYGGEAVHFNGLPLSTPVNIWLTRHLK